MKLQKLTDYPAPGDSVFEVDKDNNLIAEFMVNKRYSKENPELITVTTVKHLKNWFLPGEETIKCREELKILCP